MVGKDGGGGCCFTWGRVLTCRDGKRWWMVVVVMVEKDGGVSGSDGCSGDHRQILFIFTYLNIKNITPVTRFRLHSVPVHSREHSGLSSGICHHQNGKFGRCFCHFSLLQIPQDSAGKM